MTGADDDSEDYVIKYWMWVQIGIGTLQMFSCYSNPASVEIGNRLKFARGN